MTSSFHYKFMLRKITQKIILAHQMPMKYS